MAEKHYSLKEEAYIKIKRMILNCEYEPGSRIREDLIAEEISMSRTPVREAVHQLTSEGFIDYSPRKGNFCIELTKEKISDLLDVRMALENLAIDKCIERIDEDQLQSLKHLLKSFEENLDSGDYRKLNQLDSQFHKEIAQVSNNTKLMDFLNEIEEFMLIARTLEKKTNTKEKCEITLEEHKCILNGLKNKDVLATKKAIKHNINSMKRTLELE